MGLGDCGEAIEGTVGWGLRIDVGFVASKSCQIWDRRSWDYF